MPGRPPKVGHIRDAFLRSSQSARDLVNAVRDLSGIEVAAGPARLHPEHSRRVVELAFLGLIAAWEEFLEQSFVRYLAGATADNGYRAPLRLGQASSISHAYQLISGDPDFDPSRNYSKFGEARWVIATAKNYFDLGAPYAPILHQHAELLQHANKLRNRVAHNSAKSREDFKRSARVHLGLAPTVALTQGYGVGDLLLAPAARMFGQPVSDSGVSFFRAYVSRLRKIAKHICPGA